MLRRQVMVARIATVLLSGARWPRPSLAWAQAPADAELDALRRQVLGRFEVMPLREGIALVGRDRSRRVEIVDGLVLDAGTPLSGAELRERLGADAGLVLRLSYLDNAALRRLFAAVRATPRQRRRRQPGPDPNPRPCARPPRDHRQRPPRRTSEPGHRPHRPEAPVAPTRTFRRIRRPAGVRQVGDRGRGRGGHRRRGRPRRAHPHRRPRARRGRGHRRRRRAAADGRRPRRHHRHRRRGPDRAGRAARRGGRSRRRRCLARAGLAGAGVVVDRPRRHGAVAHARRHDDPRRACWHWRWPR